MNRRESQSEGKVHYCWILPKSRKAVSIQSSVFLFRAVAAVAPC